LYGGRENNPTLKKRVLVTNGRQTFRAKVPGSEPGGRKPSTERKGGGERRNGSGKRFSRRQETL